MSLTDKLEKYEICKKLVKNMDLNDKKELYKSELKYDSQDPLFCTADKIYLVSCVENPELKDIIGVISKYEDFDAEDNEVEYIEYIPCCDKKVYDQIGYGDDISERVLELHDYYLTKELKFTKIKQSEINRLVNSKWPASDMERLNEIMDPLKEEIVAIYKKVLDNINLPDDIINCIIMQYLV